MLFSIGDYLAGIAVGWCSHFIVGLGLAFRDRLGRKSQMASSACLGPARRNLPECQRPAAR
jgi:hypothetical protein